MNISINQSKDFELIAKLNKDVHNLEYKRHPKIFRKYNFKIMKNLFKEMLNNENNICLVINENQEPVGYVLLIKRNYNHPLFNENHKSIYIDQMSINKKYRNQGFGSILMNKVKEFTYNQGYNRIELSVWNDNTKAINFYKKMGFDNYLNNMCFDFD